MFLSMSFFDYLFPEQAQASHMRNIANSMSLSRTQGRITQARVERKAMTNEKRVSELEDEVARMTIIMEGLLELFDEKELVSRVDLARKIGEIDARDGTIDGRITPENKEPKQTEKSETKFQFPDQ